MSSQWNETTKCFSKIKMLLPERYHSYTLMVHLLPFCTRQTEIPSSMKLTVQIIYTLRPISSAYGRT